jgi:putative ABC transport system permease protein
VARAESLRARPLLGPYALLYFYRRRLRVHAAQELLAGLGVAIAVALVFATIVASAGIAGSAGEVAHTVVGPATLQIRARSSGGLDERLLARVERLPAVAQAAPLLEQTATILGPRGRRVTVNLAGADTALVVLDGLAHTLPIATISSGGIGLSRTTAETIGVPTLPLGAHPIAAHPIAVDPAPTGPSAATAAPAGQTPTVSLALRGGATRLNVSAVLGAEAFGALSQARVAVMSLASLQRLAGLPGRITRILVRARPGRAAAARAQLRAVAGAGLSVSATGQDVAALRQALRPSDQASAFFAAISALLGLLFAFNALLLTVPERRRAIADLRLIGTRRAAIVQLFGFQALCLGIVASLVGLLGGYALSLGVFHQSPRYLAEAFTLGTRTVVRAWPLALAFAGGVLATCVASAVPLLDLRRGGALDAVYREDGVPGNALGGRTQRRVALAALGLVACTTVLFALTPSLALVACALLALATVLAVPLVFAGVLGCARALSERRQRLTILPVALSSLRATTLRSLALAATGAVALFGSVALGGARGDLLRGIGGFAHSYAADADIWVGNPQDNQATVDFRPGGRAGRIARIPGVVSVRPFQGGFLELGDRRVWVIARPPGADREVLDSQIVGGNATTAQTRLEQGGWIAVSRQIAEEHHTGVGGTLTLPTPAGPVDFRIAATTTNLAWSPGAIFMSTADYGHLWATATPTALGVDVAPGASAAGVQRAIERAIGPASGLEVSSAHALQARIDALTGEGLGQLGEISTLLLIAAILAMAAALTSAIWQRRVSLASLRLSGVRSHRLRLILALESALMLGAGCVTGALLGLYGQVVIDGYLGHVTGFPVAGLGASLRPLEIFALTIAAVLAIAAVPGWLASRVSPTLALNE